MVEAAFVTHFPIPPIYPYLPFTPGYLNSSQINVIHSLKNYNLGISGWHVRGYKYTNVNHLPHYYGRVLNFTIYNNYNIIIIIITYR